MIPELAAGYAVGMIPSAALSGLHLFLHHRKMHSVPLMKLQKNLSQIQLFWSDTESEIRPLEKDSAFLDKKKYRRSVFILGGICLALSWLGFFAQLVVMASVRYLAVSRLERRIFSSPLTEKDLNPDETKRRVDEILSLSV